MNRHNFRCKKCIELTIYRFNFCNRMLYCTCYYYGGACMYRFAMDNLYNEGLVSKYSILCSKNIVFSNRKIENDIM